MNKLKEILKPTYRLLKYFNFSIIDILKYLSLSGRDKYAFMQRYHYCQLSKDTDYEADIKKEGIVGSYEQQNEWKDYDEYLMKHIDSSFKDYYALDFACGPGRNIIKYNSLFKRIDGSDISPDNLENAHRNLKYHNIESYELFQTNGSDCGEIEDNFYKFIFSTIALQHICVYDIRKSIFMAMYKGLMNHGRISIQMGYGSESKDTVNYYANYYDALGTNRAQDVRIDSYEQVKKDLEEIGFQDFEYWIRPTGPGDYHENWIFFTAVKR